MIIHKFPTICFLAFLFSVSNLFGKSAINDGYIITNQGDTILGEIKDFGLKKISKLCSFRQKDTKEFIEYKPGEIYSFRFSKKYYITKEISIEGNTDILFIEFLVDGIIDLYYLEYNNLLYYLIEDEDGKQTLMKLNSEAVKSNEDLVNAMKDESKKKGTLNYIMKDYPPIYSDLEQVNIENSRSMKNLVVSYHEGVCTEYDCIDYTKKDTKTKFFIGISYGLKLSGLSLVSIDDYFLSVQDATSEPAWSAYYGIDFSFTIPAISERFGVNTKMEFSKEEYDYTYQMNYGYGHFEGVGSLKYNYASLDINFSYSIGSGNITMVPYAGFGLNYLYNYQGFFSEDASQIPHSFTLGKRRFIFTTGVGLDIPLIKSKEIHLRPSVDYRLSLDKKVYYNMFSYNYQTLGFSLMLLKYF